MQHIRLDDVFSLLDNNRPHLTQNYIATLYKIAEEMIQKTKQKFHDICEKEKIQCFCRLELASVDTLGMCLLVTCDAKGRMTEVTPFVDYVSHWAFFEKGMRENGHAGKVNIWVPLPINKDHWHRVSHCIEDSIRNISSVVGTHINHDAYFNTIVTMMNLIIVTKSKSHLPFTSADHRAMTSLYHLLLHLAKDKASIGETLEHNAHNFCLYREDRHKRYTPDLGQFLIKSSLSRVSWDQLGSVVVEEAMIRFVKTFVGEIPTSLHENEYVQRAFDATKTNRDVIAMHSLLYQQRSSMRDGKDSLHAADYLDSVYGIPTDATLKELNDKWTQVQGMRSFEDFFHVVGVESPPNMYIYLKNAIDVSEHLAQYHNNKKRSRDAPKPSLYYGEGGRMYH